MKKCVSIILAFLICVSLTACGHEHSWQDASCTAPKTCTGCNQTEGEALGHEWIEASCEAAKTCARCGSTEGDPLGHTWQEATCAAPKTCTVCSKTEGDPLPHTLTEANYQSPAVCTECGAAEGEPRAADFETYGIVCNVEPEVDYDYHTVCWDDNSIDTVGHFLIKDYTIIDSDDTYAFEEGYEWRIATMHWHFDDENAVKYGMRLTNLGSNFYNIKQGVDTNESIDAGDHSAAWVYTVNYNGEDCTVTEVADILDQSWNNEVYTAELKLAFHVPVGYDGVVIGTANMKIENVNDSYLMDVYTNADDFLLFRMQ